MSAPHQTTPSHSLTPSKSSFRRTSGSQNPTQRTLVQPQSPRFEDPTLPVRYSPRSPPNQTLEYNSEEDEALSEEEDQDPTQQHEYFPTNVEQELTRPFQPFFTLIEDVLTSEHYHPSVHYIFADDDHDIITEAALRSLRQDDVTGSSTTAQEGDTSHEQAESILEKPGAGVNEHYLVLDIQPSLQPVVQSAIHPDESGSKTPPSQTFVVSAATSLSPAWQIESSSITTAPTIGDANDGEDEGFMLRIAGRGCVPDEIVEQNKGKTQSLSPDEAAKGEKETVEEMIERLQQRVAEIRNLLEADEDLIMENQGIVADLEEQD